MGALSGMDVALLDQWQLLSHFLQNLIFRFLQSVSLLFSLSMWQLQVLSINAGHKWIAFLILSPVLFSFLQGLTVQDHVVHVCAEIKDPVLAV